MFRRLKLQFILTNLAIISILFILLTTGAYILLQIKMINHAEFFSKRLALGINSGMLPEFPEPGRQPNKPPHDNRELPPGGQRPPFPGPMGPPPGKDQFIPVVFFVKLSLSGTIIDRSFNQPVETIPLERLVDNVKSTHRNSGIVNIQHSDYFYYKTPLQKQPGTLIVFQDLKPEINIQRTLVVMLSVTGIVFLFLSMLGSLFMANRAIGPIQKAWQQQKDFLADASHELRTPLTIIQTNLEVVLGNPQSLVVSQMDWLSNIKGELQQMIGLVSSLLFLARVDSQQSVMQVNCFSLDQAVERIAESCKPLAAAKNIQINLSLTGDITFYGDESNIRQVLEILLDNAVRHTPEGGVISIDLRKTERKILLTVADTGEGISEEHRAKIFNRFYQADASRSGGGAGLGLSIAKSIIENHSGTIQVASRSGTGSIFTIQLPLNRE